MKAIFAWLSLIAALANIFAIASGEPEEMPAIYKNGLISGRYWKFKSVIFPSINLLINLVKTINQHYHCSVVGLLSKSNQESKKIMPSSKMKKSSNVAMTFARMGSGGSGSPGGPGTYGNLLLA